MAARFGASPAQVYATKVRYLIGALIAVIAVLLILIVVVANNNSGTQDVLVNDPAAVQAAVPLSQNVDVLVANVRIEQGTQLMPHLFVDQSYSPDRVPAGAILARDKANVMGKFAKNMVNANFPIMLEDVTESAGGSFIDNIPPGYRAVTITVDARSGVEGWARPGTRVDILLTYTDKKSGEKAVVTLVSFTQVLSVAGMTASDQGNKQPVSAQGTTVTLMVTEKDSKRIELARTMGTLSLSLRSSRGGPDDEPSDRPVIIKPGNIISDQEDAPEVEPAEGVLYRMNPKTGRQDKYVLRRGRWSLDTEE
ncbi:MAG: Flp pilus assembly protein CpaB [Deltaproteobacteria bacterium]|nr:Flp pilus assembly protein CpaB [Deltaproteobacteria bacterium]